MDIATYLLHTTDSLAQPRNERFTKRWEHKMGTQDGKVPLLMGTQDGERSKGQIPSIRSGSTELRVCQDPSASMIHALDLKAEIVGRSTPSTTHFLRLATVQTGCLPRNYASPKRVKSINSWSETNMETSKLMGSSSKGPYVLPPESVRSPYNI